MGESWVGKVGWALQLEVACPHSNPGGPQGVRLATRFMTPGLCQSVDSVTFIRLKMASL